MPTRPGLRPLLRALGRRLPRTAGTIHVEGLGGPVRIGRDRWGIPHIEAEREADAWFGLGFCHGQDRGFQLELLARAGRGTLAELLGRAALPLDRLSRTLGFARTASVQVDTLASSIRATLDAYVAGVNASIAAGPRPHELVLLRAERSGWRIEDVLAFVGLQSLALGANWDSELARLRILSADGPDALRKVDHTYAPWLPATTPVGSSAGPVLDRLSADLDRLRSFVGGAGASNAWAIGPGRTATGAAILANDPHLAPSVPAPWYLAHLATPGWGVAGASFVGGPVFPSGHNGEVAWGITAGCTDSSDLFWESIDTGALTARGPEGEEPVERIVERIEVRGAAPVDEEVLITRRGPVITPLLDDVGVALSLRATWLEPAPLRGFLDAHHATDFKTFREGFADWPGPSLNVVYADARGHIGWQLVGTLPRRRGGNGTIPLPAWDPEVGWEGEHLPFDEMPCDRDPEAGFVVSANNAARADTPDAPFLGVDWLDGYRAARLVEALGDRASWDVASTAALQHDLVALPWRELRDRVLRVEPSDADARLALALLATWDGRVEATSAAASVYELMLSRLAAQLAQRAAPRSWGSVLGAGEGPAIPRTSFTARTVSGVVAALGAMADPELATVVEKALGEAVATLRERAGSDPAGWAWGRVRPLRLLHAFAAQPPLGRIFNLGPVPLGGDTNTVPQAGVLPLDPFANPAVIANHRTVIDLADVERSRFVLAGGQSANPFSPHYADLFRLWRRGESAPIAWSPAAVADATERTLVLQPIPRFDG